MKVRSVSEISSDEKCTVIQYVTDNGKGELVVNKQEGGNYLIETTLALEAVVKVLHRWKYEAIDASECNQLLLDISVASGVSIEALKGTSKLSDITQVRQIFCYLAYISTSASYQAIAKIINRDHTTVLWACRVVERELTQPQSKMFRKFKLIKDKLNEEDV